MANKYEAESIAAQREWHRQRSCVGKAAFDTEAEAQHKGQSTYQCEHCGKWHRATAPGKKALRHIWTNRRKRKR